MFEDLRLNACCVGFGNIDLGNALCRLRAVIAVVDSQQRIARFDQLVFAHEYLVDIAGDFGRNRDAFRLNIGVVGGLLVLAVHLIAREPANAADNCDHEADQQGHPHPRIPQWRRLGSVLCIGLLHNFRAFESHVLSCESLLRRNMAALA